MYWVVVWLHLCVWGMHLITIGRKGVEYDLNWLTQSGFIQYLKYNTYAQEAQVFILLYITK